VALTLHRPVTATLTRLLVRHTRTRTHNRFGSLKLGLLSNDLEVISLGEGLRMPVVVQLQNGDAEETARQLASGTSQLQCPRSVPVVETQH
jgi:hypothetical protein